MHPAGEHALACSCFACNEQGNFEFGHVPGCLHNLCHAWRVQEFVRQTMFFVLTFSAVAGASFHDLALIFTYEEHIEEGRHNGTQAQQKIENFHDIVRLAFERHMQSPNNFTPDDQRQGYGSVQSYGGHGLR